MEDAPATKVKNPGRVAAGTRLAEHNRLMREAKEIAEKQDPTIEPTPVPSYPHTSPSSSSSSPSYLTILLLGLGGIAALTLIWKHRGGCDRPFVN